MEFSTETLRKKLEQFSQLVDEEVQQIGEGTQKPAAKTPETDQYKELYEDLEQVITELAHSGDNLNYEWAHLRSYLIICMRNVLWSTYEQFPDFKQSGGDTYEDELDVVLEFLYSFDEKPPFTLERICELLLDPHKYYKSAKKIIFAMEKLVNVSPIEMSTP